MISQSPLAAKICDPRPDWFRAATAIATTPSPKQMSTNVPTSSETSSPPVERRRRVTDPIAVAGAVTVMSRGRTVVVDVGSGSVVGARRQVRDHDRVAVVDLLDHVLDGVVAESRGPQHTREAGVTGHPRMCRDAVD